MVYLDQNIFMTELTKLYIATKTKGSVWLTMKRVERRIGTGTGKLETDGPVCLVRATDGKKKLACIVSSEDHVQFHMDLMTVIKTNTDKLLKPKRINKKKPTK